MSSQWFKEKQKQLNKSNAQMATLLCVSVTHVEHMRGGRRRVTDSTKAFIQLLIDKGEGT